MVVSWWIVAILLCDEWYFFANNSVSRPIASTAMKLDHFEISAYSKVP